MQVRFWGVRGSVAVSGADVARVGGNTTCVELQAEGQRLILDGGTGLASLGRSLAGPVDTTLLFTHVHWDHIQGVPFFGPLFHPDSRVQLGGHRTAWGGLEQALEAQMRPPLFPIGPSAFRAQIRYRDVESAKPFEVGPFRVTAVLLDHPDGVLAYRIEAGGSTVVFATDVEHADGLDPELVKLAEDADLLIHDAQFTDAEYRGEAGPSRVGWGHSTWTQALAVADAAGAGKVALFHHDPARNDDAVAVLESRANEVRPGTFAAREGSPVAV
jgi:phosphoribosyl 1,2-cyclic phosphodiesterase